MRRNRQAKIVATLGPASTDESIITRLFESGVDVFRLNFSHGTFQDHQARYNIIRSIEQKYGYPVGVLLDLQGPKLRIGTFTNGSIELNTGDKFRLDIDPIAGDQKRVSLPHKEIFEVLQVGADLLVDDGRVRLRVLHHGSDFAEMQVINGGKLSDRKGVNVPGVVLPLSAMTDKDRKDLTYGLNLGVDWVALSFVQRPQDIRDIKAIVQGRVGIIAKIEKPSAVRELSEIIHESDGIMVARGDLGVELPAEQVPPLQKRIVRECRSKGKPVIVATQMLESMVQSPVPTRAESSDVATAIYDGVDAVMLSAESASGQYPAEAVRMMNSIICEVENDPLHQQLLDASHVSGEHLIGDAICGSMREATIQLKAAATVSYTTSGFSSLRVARERPRTPIVSLSFHLKTSRRLTLVWGVHSVHLPKELESVQDMVFNAMDVVRDHGFAKTGDIIIIVAGIPFGTAGTTNLLHIVTI